MEVNLELTTLTIHWQHLLQYRYIDTSPAFIIIMPSLNPKNSEVDDESSSSDRSPSPHHFGSVPIDFGSNPAPNGVQRNNGDHRDNGNQLRHMPYSHLPARQQESQNGINPAPFRYRPTPIDQRFTPAIVPMTPRPALLSPAPVSTFTQTAAPAWQPEPRRDVTIPEDVSQRIGETTQEALARVSNEILALQLRTQLEYNELRMHENGLVEQLMNEIRSQRPPLPPPVPAVQYHPDPYDLPVPLPYHPPPGARYGHRSRSRRQSSQDKVPHNSSRRRSRSPQQQNREP